MAMQVPEKMNSEQLAICDYFFASNVDVIRNNARLFLTTLFNQPDITWRAFEETLRAWLLQNEPFDYALIYNDAQLLNCKIKLSNAVGWAFSFVRALALIDIFKHLHSNLELYEPRLLFKATVKAQNERFCYGFFNTLSETFGPRFTKRFKETTSFHIGDKNLIGVVRNITGINISHVKLQQQHLRVYYNTHQLSKNQRFMTVYKVPANVVLAAAWFDQAQLRLPGFVELKQRGVFIGASINYTRKRNLENRNHFSEWIDCTIYGSPSQINETLDYLNAIGYITRNPTSLALAHFYTIIEPVSANALVQLYG